MTPPEAGARALWLQEHPNVDPSCWDMLDEGMRAWWVEKARPVVEAAAAIAWQEGYRLGVNDERTSASNIGIAGDLCGRTPCVCKIEPARTNPYRSAA